MVLPGHDPLPAAAQRALERAVRRGVDPLIWRLVTSEDIPEGLAEIRRSWSAGDIADAHEWLDALEEARAHSREAAKKKAEAEAKRRRR